MVVRAAPRSAGWAAPTRDIAQPRHYTPAILYCRAILREVKQSGEIHLVLDCDTDKVAGLLGEAMAAGMMTAYHNYLITRCCDMTVAL